VINGVNYTLEPFEYILSAGTELRYEREPQASGVCGFGYSIFDVGDKNVWIAGDIFLTKYFSVYDRDKDLVGLALANHSN
jgi:cathepsin E